MAQTPPSANPAAELIAQLREARSPLARARIVVRAWRAVRSLSPRDRSDLVAGLGLEGADDLVEAIAAHQGTKPPAGLIQAVNQVNRLDPEALRSVATRMREPGQRGGLLKQGLQVLESKLAGPEPPLRPPPGPPAGFTAVAAAQPPAPPPIPLPVQAAPAPAPVAVIQAAPAFQPAAPPPAPAPLKPVPAQPVPIPVPVPAPEAAAVVSAVRGGLAVELAAVPALTSRFRLLRRRLSAVRQLSPGELRGVVEAFADGWARRRALSELLETGIPERTADALALVDSLQSPGDRSWCLGTLAASRALPAEERAAVLQAAPTPAGRRRLGLRLDKA